ncbi:hypothetical protein [Paenibacillus tyrfis]|uniref:hypothetical protein n=1 Tax=Paenibacillus tyrfis TaxID=1501230 RepID=UPI000B590B20|nr:hypothetical protein [Paenibacillus tyrfis]
MTHVSLRPDLRTAGGEVSDIMFKNRFVGTLTLVFRESDRIAGALQLEKEVLDDAEKDEVFDAVHRYVDSLLDALQAKGCEVMVTYSSFDHVIASEREAETYAGVVSTEEDFDYDSDWIDNDTRLEDEPPWERNDFTMADFELVLVGEDEDGLEYHLYDRDEDFVAEIFLQVEDREVTGTVYWMIEPDEAELDIAADLLVLDFDEDEVDRFEIAMSFDNEIFEVIQLTHEDLLAEEDDSEVLWSGGDGDKPYTVMLVRDDGGVLTYEIYQQARGGLPIGSATVDISERQLTGFIDFREPGSTDDRELIATLLMEELDKEKDYSALNLSMMHNNRLIEEVLFETENVH